MSESPLSHAFKQFAIAALLVVVVVGMAADILNPFAPFAMILLGVSLLSLVVCCLIGMKSGWQKVAVGLVFTLVATVLMGCLVVMQLSFKSKLGFLAEVIPAVKTLQEKLPLPDLPPPPELPDPPGGLPKLPLSPPGESPEEGEKSTPPPRPPRPPAGGPPGLP
jgi:hypothetical protein